MRIRKPGRINERLWMLGREESSVYLLQGDKSSMIISGGMSYIVPEILSQFEEFGIDEGRIKKILILHSHFDHIGIVPFFKRRCPGIEVYASKRAWEILQMDKAIPTINEFSRNVAERMGFGDIYSSYDLEWSNDLVGQTISEGDRIDLGGLGVLILEIPGHSSCCIAGYVPELKALFPSDGGGIPFDDTIIASGNSNYTKYQESLEKLKDLDVEYYCADHYGYVIGEEAKGFIKKTIEKAKEHRLEIERIYRSTRDIDLSAKKMTESFYEVYPSYFLAPEIFLDVHRQMIRHIANIIEGKI